MSLNTTACHTHATYQSARRSVTVTHAHRPRRLPGPLLLQLTRQTTRPICQAGDLERRASNLGSYLCRQLIGPGKTVHVSERGSGVTMARVPWSTVRHLVLKEGSGLEPECVEAIRLAIPDGSAQVAEIGFPLAANLLDIYQYRYQSIEAFRVRRYGWSGFFSALTGADGRVGLLAIRCSGWRFTILLNENLDAALACLCRSPSPDEAMKHSKPEGE